MSAEPGVAFPLERFALSFDVQSKFCANSGSLLYAGLCAAARDALPTHRGLRALAARFAGDPLKEVFAIRLLGGVHALVLAGEAPALAAFFPTAGGSAPPAGAGDPFLRVVDERADELAPWLAAFPQTNEVRRSAALLGGFLEIAAATGLPLALREIGSSAGLNQLFDRFHYALGPHRWGDERSPVRLVAAWQTDATPPFDATIRVASRSGCDLAPVGLESAESRRRLEAYVWADQIERFENLRAAIGLARDGGIRVERARAEDWLARELAPEAAATRIGVTTVVFHSVMWAYVPSDERERIARTIEAAGERATAAAPLAWLQLEDGMPRTAVRLRLWPHAPGERVLAESHPHATWVHWHVAR